MHAAWSSGTSTSSSSLRSTRASSLSATNIPSQAPRGNVMALAAVLNPAAEGEGEAELGTVVAESTALATANSEVQQKGHVWRPRFEGDQWPERSY
jgi:hypothetical protein